MDNEMVEEYHIIPAPPIPKLMSKSPYSTYSSTHLVLTYRKLTKITYLTINIFTRLKNEMQRNDKVYIVMQKVPYDVI